MSFEDVMKRGDDFLSESPRKSKLWNFASHATCLFMILSSKAFLNTCYKPKLSGLDKLDEAMARSKRENRALLTVMNHMSVVDDPFFVACLPLKYSTHIDNIRWGFGAANVCFADKYSSFFFSLGKILGTERFGAGPFQGSVDAAIRILSPDDTMDLEFTPGVKIEEKPLLMQEINSISKNPTMDTKQIAEVLKTPATHPMKPLPFVRNKPSWFHVFPEGFVLQLEQPHSNSMRYFKWGVARLILESTRAPIVVPIFTTGFEKISPESTAEQGIKRFLPNNMGAEIHLKVGDAIDDEIIEDYRRRWRELCKKHIDPKKPTDLSKELKEGNEAKSLRSELAAVLRQSVLGIRKSLDFLPEDPRFKDPRFWKEFTNTEGDSAPEVQFVGKNWAIRRHQKSLPDYSEVRKN